MKAVLAGWFGLRLLVSAASVLPPNSTVDGKPIGDWTAEWWQWVLPIPTKENPHLDTDGRWAHVGQPRGSVFFLGGVLGFVPGAVTRTFTVPENKFLLVPLLEVASDNFNVFPPFTIEELREQSANIVLNPAELHASIDGLPIAGLFDDRVISPVFSYDFTNADNLLSFAYGVPIVGFDDPIAADGYWLMLEPLYVGWHVLNYGGTYRNSFFYPNDVVARITVVPVPLEQWMEEFLAVVKDLESGIRNHEPLVASLQRARNFFAAKLVQAGIGQLRAFQNQVQAQVAPDDPLLAEELSHEAQRIIRRAETESPKVPNLRSQTPNPK